MQKKNLVIIGILLLTSVLLAWLVIAVSPSDTLRVVSPAGGTRVLWLNGTLIFNATFMNGTLGLGSGLSDTPLFNGSFLFNTSGGWIQVANVTNGCIQIGTTGTFACTANVTNLTVAEGNYTLTFNVTNGTNGGSGANSIIANLSGNYSESIVIDHTAPIVSNANASSPFATGSNISGAQNGNFTFNVSVGDAVLGVQAVVINMTNASSDMVRNLTLVQEGTTNRYIASINTTLFTDGYFNITIHANDSLGNLNDSARFLRMIIDNTGPIVETANVSSPFIAGSNLSSNFTFNVSVGDALAGVQTVIINMTNSTANAMVLNLTTVREGSTNQFVTSINTSRFADGYYNITIISNDTAGNLNSSTIVQRMIIDNTRPIVGNSNVSSPFTAGSNISSSVNGNFTFNVSVGDALAGVQSVIINITNSTNNMVRNLTLVQEGTVNRYIASINTTLLTGDGYYNITILTNDTAGNQNNTAVVTRIIIDNTRPIVAAGNVSAPFSAGSNISSRVNGNFTFNVSVGDALAGVQSVRINITNSTNNMVRNLTLVQEGTTNRYIASINTTLLSGNGYYNITILTNDSAGNQNNTAVVTRIVIDNTIPSASLSCTPNPVEQNDVITCACTASDATAGLNLSFGTNGVSTTTNPSTALTGPSFEVGCTVKDTAGNTATTTTTYAVTSGGGGTGGGSSSGGSSSGGGGLSPSSSSSSGGSSESEEPETSVSGSEQGANAGGGSSAKGLGTTSTLIIAIIIIAAIIVAVVIMIKRKNS